MSKRVLLQRPDFTVQVEKRYVQRHSMWLQAPLEGKSSPSLARFTDALVLSGISYQKWGPKN